MQEAGTLAPTIAEPQINIGFYFLESRRFGLAKYQFDRLQAALPSDPRILFGLAMTAHRMGQYVEAKQRWEGLLETEPAGLNAATARALLREGTSRAGPATAVSRGSHPSLSPGGSSRKSASPSSSRTWRGSRLRVGLSCCRPSRQGEAMFLSVHVALRARPCLRRRRRGEARGSDSSASPLRRARR